MFLNPGSVGLAVAQATVVPCTVHVPGHRSGHESAPRLLGPPFAESPAPAMLQLVVLESGGRRMAVVVDDLHDERELVLRPLEHAGRTATNAIVGPALLSSGAVALVLSVPALRKERAMTPVERGAW